MYDMISAAMITAVVQQGNTLSGLFGSSWPAVCAANHLPNCNEIYPGQVIYGSTLTSYQPTAQPVTGDEPDGDADDPQQAAQPVQAPQTSPAYVPYSSGGSFQSCVISRESGGNPNAMNASGHWGLYQFSASTYAEYGGTGFGYASAAEQTAVFNTAISEGGAYNWVPYDHC